MNSKQALLTMAEYINLTYPMMQQQRLRYDEQAIFMAANLEVQKRKRQAIKEADSHLDWSLASLTKVQKIKTVCECRRCEGEYYMVTWPNRNAGCWPVEEGSCIYCVTLQLARIAMRTGRDNDPHLIERLKERTRCKPVISTEPI